MADTRNEEWVLRWQLKCRLKTTEENRSDGNVVAFLHLIRNLKAVSTCASYYDPGCIRMTPNRDEEPKKLLGIILSSKCSARRDVREKTRSILLLDVMTLDDAGSVDLSELCCVHHTRKRANFNKVSLGLSRCSSNLQERPCVRLRVYLFRSRQTSTLFKVSA